MQLVPIVSDALRSPSRCFPFYKCKNRRLKVHVLFLHPKMNDLSGPVELGALGQRAAGALDDNVGAVVARSAALRHVLAAHELGQEPTHERIASTVGVDEVLLCERDDGVQRHLAVLGDDGGVRALGEDNGAAARAVLLWQLGDLERNLRHVAGLPAGHLRICDGLGLVTEEEVDIGKHVLHGGPEGRHLHDEGGGEVHGVDFGLCARVLGHLQHGVWGHRQEEPCGVVELGVLHDLPVLRLLQMVNLVVVGRREVGAQGALAPEHADTAGTSGIGGLHEVRVHALLGALALHRLAVVVTTDATHVGSSSLGHEHPLRDADAVKGGAAGDELNVGASAHFLVDREVLLLSKDSVVHLETPLVEPRLVNDAGDIEQRVAHAEESVLKTAHFC
mmetsp:Transcript_40377/g.48953  ORF Transcript_40377/g.48953 Transcript_40377/m.48953 type:complete len:391 (-) Transcript_40377:49-1221(-)